MKKIFMVGEDEAVSLAIKALPEQSGHKVQRAQSALRGIFQLPDRRPDAAFIDAGSPDADGLEAARRIGVMPGEKEIGLIACVDAGSIEIRARAISAGFDYCLRKPADQGKLDVLIQRRTNHRASWSRECFSKE